MTLTAWTPLCGLLIIARLRMRARIANDLRKQRMCIEHKCGYVEVARMQRLGDGQDVVVPVDDVGTFCGLDLRTFVHGQRREVRGRDGHEQEIARASLIEFVLQQSSVRGSAR